MARGSAHDMETRMEAAVAWLITGSTLEASKLCNVPQRTIHDWTKTAWWEDLLIEARSVKQQELDALWTGLIHDATGELRDRVRNGEQKLDRKGEVRRIPVCAKDLAFIASIAVEKRALMRGQATARVEKVSVEKQLDMIKERIEEKAIDNEADEATIR